MEIIAGVALVVAVVAAGTLGVREWGNCEVLWRAILAAILASTIGQGVALVVFTPILMVLVTMRLWWFPPGASAYNMGNLVRMLAGLWSCRLLGDSFGWF